MTTKQLLIRSGSKRGSLELENGGDEVLTVRIRNVIPGVRSCGELLIRCKDHVLEPGEIVKLSSGKYASFALVDEKTPEESRG